MKTKTYGMFALPVLAAIMVVGTMAPVFAEDPLGSNGVNWGAATAFYAQYYDMGDHASDQEEPRIGLGNLKSAFGGDWCAVLDFLNDFDDAAVLTCAEQAED